MLKAQGVQCERKYKGQRQRQCVSKKRKGVQSGSLAGLIIQGFTRSDQRSEDRIARVIWVNPKGTGRKGALLRDVYGELTPKEKRTSRVRAHGGG